MITYNSLQIIESLSRAINESGLKAIAVNNTYLEELYNCSPIIVSPDQDANSAVHDILQDKIIDVLTKSIIGQLGFLRGEIIPTISTIYEDVRKTLQSYEDGNDLSRVEIIQRRIPDILSAPDVAADIAKFRDTPLSEAPSDVVTKDLQSPEANIANRIRLAASEYYASNTSAPAEYINQLTDDTIIQSLYNHTRPTNTTSHYDMAEDLTKKYILNEVLRNNEDLAMDILETSGLDHLRNTLDSVRLYTLSLLSKTLDMIDSRSNNNEGLLVLRLNARERIIEVNGPVYENFLKNGGSPDVLLGLMADGKSNPSDYFYHSLLDGKERFLSIYEKYLTLIKMDVSLNYFNQFKSFFKVIFNTHMQNLSETEKSYFTTNPDAFDEVSRRMESMLDALVLGNLDTPKHMYKTVERIVTQSRFYYTSAYDLLRYMEEEHSEGTEISSTVAIAVIFYLVDYFVDQMHILRN